MHSTIRNFLERYRNRGSAPAKARAAFLRQACRQKFRLKSQLTIAGRCPIHQKEVLDPVFTAQTMTLGESLIISLLGLATVFTCLIVLSLAIMLFSRVFALAEGGKKAPAPAAAPAAPAFDEESYAAIIAAVSEETGLPLDKFQITSIKEL